MKKLLIATLMLGAAFAAVAEEAAPAAPAPAAAEAAPAKKAPAKLDRAKLEARMKARLAERVGRTVEVLKKYGLDDEKAKACAEELVQTMMRPPRPAKKPAGKKPAGKKPAPEAK